MILNRTIAPKAEGFQDIVIPKLGQIILPNNVNTYFINSGTQPVVKLELVFDAGNKYEEKIGQSYFTAKMLAEGTQEYSSAMIAEMFAQIGYFVDFTQGSERLVITLNGLVDQLGEAILIAKEIIQNSIFPEKELENIKKITRQNLSINQEKTSHLAITNFKEHVFGDDNFVGHSLNEADIDLISSNDLIEFYNSNIRNKKFRIFMSGKISDDQINIINEIFGTLDAQNIIEKPEPVVFSKSIQKKYKIEKEGSIQSSIRIGRRMIDKNHDDYFPLKVFNTVLGGYFGSRLMKNIREDKGYTYGISSSLFSIPKYGYLLIGTDVKSEFAQNTLNEIYKEILKLQKQQIDNEELEVVKNFIIGDFMGSLNTPFEIIEKHKVIIYEHLSNQYFDHFVKNINAVNSDQLIEIANKYFNEESLIEVVAG